jgi:hypothetical protein
VVLVGILLENCSGIVSLLVGVGIFGGLCSWTRTTTKDAKTQRYSATSGEDSDKM